MTNTPNTKTERLAESILSFIRMHGGSHIRIGDDMQSLYLCDASQLESLATAYKRQSEALRDLAGALKFAVSYCECGEVDEWNETGETCKACDKAQAAIDRNRDVLEAVK